MLYSLFRYLEDFNFPGHRLMDYITFRAGISFALALLLGLTLGNVIIRKLQKMQIGEVVRNLGLEGQMQKKGTPTMGGVIIIMAILVPCLLLGNLGNIYMILMLVATVWMGGRPQREIQDNGPGGPRPARGNHHVALPRHRDA